MSDERDAILEAVLPNVAFDGWSETALRAGAASLGHDAAAADILFPDGPRDLAAQFTGWLCRRAEAEAGLEEGMRTSQRIRALLHAYFRALAPHREAERRRLAFLAMPGNAGLALRLTADAADRLWRAAGDRSTDTSHYTKRLTLGAVVASATLFWLDDQSPGGADTLAFVDRRLADVGRFGQAMARIRSPRLTDILPNPRRFVRQCRARFRDQPGPGGA
jgi:ubiquinone biosynthesis protein COQ9